MSPSKQVFLDTYDREHAITMRVLRAYPADQLDLRPHPKCKTAREQGAVDLRTERRRTVDVTWPAIALGMARVKNVQRSTSSVQRGSLGRASTLHAAPCTLHGRQSTPYPEAP